jgi:hypothetical protein
MGTFLHGHSPLSGWKRIALLFWITIATIQFTFTAPLASTKSIPGPENRVRKIFSLAAQSHQPHPSQVSQPQRQRPPPPPKIASDELLGLESETLSLSPISKSYQGGPGAMWQGEDLSVDPYTTGNTYAKAEQLEFDLPGSYSVAPSGSTNGQQLPAVIVDGSEPPATQSLSNVGGLNAASPITWVNETVTNEDALAYEKGAPGWIEGKAPQLSASDAEGTVTAKFDGVDGNVMVDRKLSVMTYPKSLMQALRQSAVAAENGYAIRWEVPDLNQANRATNMFNQLGIKNIQVVIVPTK